MIVIENSSNFGFFKIDGVEHQQKKYVINFDNEFAAAGEINFSLIHIETGLKPIKSRGFAEISGVTSWAELFTLLNMVEALSCVFGDKDIKKDVTGRQSLNTVFGDLITGIRKSSIGAQFQYGIKEGDSDPVVVGSGSISIVDSLLIMSTGTDADGHARIESVETIRYVPAQETYCYFTLVFSTPQLNSSQFGGLFDDENGFFVGYDTDGVFKFIRRRNSVNFKQVIDLTAFLERYGYVFDPTKGNIYRISYGYLGFAPISLEVVRPEGGFALLSKINYPNTETVTHTLQTFLPVRGQVTNSGNTSDIVLKSGSLAAGITDGRGNDIAGRRFNYSNSAVFTISGNTTIIAFRNKATFNGIQNRVAARLLQVSGANELNKNVRWKIYKNPTFSNTPTWSDVDTNNSVLEYSTDAVVNTGVSNDLFMAWNVQRLGDFLEYVEGLKLDLRPNGEAAFVLETTGSGEADISIRWNELF